MRMNSKKIKWKGKNQASEMHAGQSVLTLQVNKWKALKETTVSFESNKLKALTDLGLLEQACRNATTTIR